MRRQPSFRISKAQLGMLLLLTSLSVLFVASLVAFGITRARSQSWQAPGMPGLPQTLWLSTALLVVVSATLELAFRDTQHNRTRRAAHALNLAWLSALGFVASQVLSWHAMRAGVQAYTTLYPFTYFFLTGLHAAHVLAGFVPLRLVRQRLQQGEYSSSRHEGLKLCVQYWHFLGVVWLILFLALGVST
jgi:cytochrome c oxidase subunit 3